MNSAQLDLIFSALSDPTRRGILAELSQGESNVRSLVDHYNMSQPAISKHLRVLEQSGLISRTKRGRENIVRIDPRPIEGAIDWVKHYSQFWRMQFDAVEEYLQDKKDINTRGK
ncbi:MAG: metalloregulator ArsR/SmtB family transcription factor [Pseudomonadales bacterium]|nr:metalloregulator ArsR/SmtB family transcription factor [Pseudomonadales bacterium]